MKPTPWQCPKSASPYNGCPFVFKHEDDQILDYVDSLAQDIKRVMGDEAAEAREIDRASCLITAYMNGRIAQILSRDNK